MYVQFASCVSWVKTAFMKSYFLRLKPKVIYYRNFKRFDKQKFIIDVKNADFPFETGDPNEN